MSIMHCDRHDYRWDSDKLEICPLCTYDPVYANGMTIENGMHWVPTKESEALAAESKRLMEEWIKKEKEVDEEVKALHGEFDAAHWAHTFVRFMKYRPSIATDEGAMLAWFSNAIMAGYDKGKRDSIIHIDQDGPGGASRS